jgi:hypothetical protein
MYAPTMRRRHDATMPRCTRSMLRVYGAGF